MSKLRRRGSGRDSRIRQTCRSGQRASLGRRGVLVRARDPGIRERANDGVRQICSLRPGRSGRSAETKFAGPVGTMSLRTRLIGPCATFGGEANKIDVNLGALVRRLLLFDTYILQSFRLLEVPALVSAFGFSGLRALLQSGALRIQCEAVTIANTGQVAVLESRRQKGVLPLGSYSLSVVQSGDREEYLSHCLKHVNEAPGRLKDVIKLKQFLIGVLHESSASAAFEALPAALRDLQDAKLLRKLIGRVSKEVAGVDVDPAALVVAVQTLDEHDFRVESNLSAQHRLDELTSHKVVEKAILAAANLNFMIAEMRAMNALSGIVESEMDVFADKLFFVAADVAPETQEKRFVRVLELAGFPTTPLDAGIDSEALLKVRESRECREFREWLQRTDSATDAEIREQISSLREKLDGVVQSGVGKTLRFLATTGLGLVPGVGPVMGTAASALDMFLVDKLFQQAGPAAFVNRQYPSIFSKGVAE